MSTPDKTKKEKSSNEEHALLSASGSHKWLHCNPSARLEATLPEVESTYSNEGGLAHEIGELKLRKAFTEPMGPKTFTNRLKKLQEKPLYAEEMLKHTDTYLDLVSKIAHEHTSPPYVAVEKRIDYSTYAPEGFGTCDCIIIGNNTMHVIDLKYGKGVPVSAHNNPQMMLYALGAYVEYSFLYHIETVKMIIVQPRLDSVSEFVLPASALLAWGLDLKPIALRAFNGEGEFVQGEHCKFCKAKATCRARSDFFIPLEEYKQAKPPLISNEEVGNILLKAQGLASWAKELEEYALAEILKGNEIIGWKAVEGRSTRKFVDQDKAFEIIQQQGIAEAMLYKREPLTLTATEELIGKAKFKELLSDFVTKYPGKPTLVTLSDKREPITRNTAAEDFAPEVS